MAALLSVLVNGGSRKFYRWCHLRSYYLYFFLVTLKVQGGPKSDEMLHIFRPRSQTFCSHARTQQNIVILKTNSYAQMVSLQRMAHLMNFAYKPLRYTRHKILKKM